jgi:flagellar hook-length control protein FliK
MFFATVTELRTPVESSESATRNTRNRSDDGSRGRDTRVDRADNSSRNNLRTRSNTAQETDTEVSNGVSHTEQPTQAPVETEVDEQQAIVAIAAVLQLPVEEVAAILEQLNMDIQDLTEPKMVSKLLQFVMGAETPTDLLKDPNFPEMFKTINEKMANLALEAETTVISGKSVDVGAQLLEFVDKMQITDIEGLEVSVEDGQVVVTNDKTATTSDTTQTTVTVEQDAPQAELKHNEGEGLKMADLEAPQQEQPQVAVSTFDANSPKTVAQEIIKNSTPTPQADATKVIEQIMSQVKVTNFGGNFAEMRLTLRPESLGDIVLRVMTQNGIVTAQFEAENQRVKETLEANFNQLREALEQQGLAFSELSVSVRQEKGNASEFERGRQSTRHRMASINGVGEAEEELPPPVVSLHDGVIDVTA